MTLRWIVGVTNAGDNVGGREYGGDVNYSTGGYLVRRGDVGNHLITNVGKLGGSFGSDARPVFHHSEKIIGVGLRANKILLIVGRGAGGMRQLLW